MAKEPFEHIENNDLAESAVARYRALGLPDDFLNHVLVPDAEAEEAFNNLNEETRRKVIVGLALMQLQIPDDIRCELLSNHLDETERLVQEAGAELVARLIAQTAVTTDVDKQAKSGSVRLALLMNILGFDSATLSGVLTDPSLSRRAGLIAQTGLNDMGQKIQQLYDEKQNEPSK